MHNTEISNANPSETLDASNFYKEHLLKFTRAYLLSVGISSLEFLDMADNDVESFHFHTDRINEAIAKAELDLTQQQLPAQATRILKVKITSKN